MIYRKEWILSKQMNQESIHSFGKSPKKSKSKQFYSKGRTLKVTPILSHIAWQAFISSCPIQSTTVITTFGI